MDREESLTRRARAAILRIYSGGVAVITKVQKWGNSQGLRLSKQLLSDAEISVGDAVEVAVRDGAIVVAPVRRVRGRHDLRQLVRRIPKDYTTEEVDWGRPVGREVW
jgi:antitoxin MazE